MTTKKTFTNQEIAQLLRNIAAVYEIKGNNRFKITAYQRAADSIEHASSEIKDFWDENQLGQISGIGKSIAAHLDELFKTGKVKHFEKLISKLPPATFIFLNIPGIGPKTAYKLAKNLGINQAKNAIQRLKKAAKQNKISHMPNFGAKSEQKILEGIALMAKTKKREKRMLLPYADQVAQELIVYLKKLPATLETHPLGSLRRKVSTIGDIDIAVKTKQPNKVIEHFTKFSKIKRILSKGKKGLCRVILTNNCQIDLRTQNPQSYGAMLQYFTGSKHHNIALRELALKKGLSLSEYGIKTVKNPKSKVKSFADEKDFYNYLGMDWIPPELRENTGEIKAAQKHHLPNLIQEKDIKGDLHSHSNFNIEPSHDLGQDSMIAMVQKAIKFKYQYFAFSEHNPSLNQHTDKQIINLLKRKKEIVDKINYSIEKHSKKRVKKLPFFVFNSLEIDIRPDGSVAIPQKGFAYLDFAIVSIHSQFNLPKKQMTQRIIKALSQPKVKILGHPTGRLLNERESYELDREKIFSFCFRNNKILEINSYPNRLDLPDTLIRQAIQYNVKLVINTDAHALDQLDFIKYGVAVARRGWAEKKDIINTRSLKEIKKILLN